MIGFVADITDRHALEEQLRHAQKMGAVGRLAGGVAHDFNNLLMSVLGHSQLVLDELEGNAPLRVPIETIRQAAGTWCSADPATTFLQPAANHYASDPRSQYHFSGDGKPLTALIGEDIELATTFRIAPALIQVDATQLQQVLMNLAVNARDAMPKAAVLRSKRRSCYSTNLMHEPIRMCDQDRTSCLA